MASSFLLTKKDDPCYNIHGGGIMQTSANITMLIDALRTLCDAGICYYDLKNFFNYNKLGVQANRGHYCEFCHAARDLPDGRFACNKSDTIDAVALAEQYRHPFFFECHLGMKELILPLFHENALIGIIFIGQCRIEGETNEKLIIQRAREAGGDPKKFQAYLQKLPILTREKLRNIGLILSIYFNIHIQHGQPLGLPDSPQTVTLAKRAYAYITEHYKDDLSLSFLALRYYVSSDHLARSFRMAYNMTITQYLHSVRIKHAKHLLIITNAPISKISLDVGYQDVNYFSRIFKSHVGLSPSAFRKNAPKE